MRNSLYKVGILKFSFSKARYPQPLWRIGDVAINFRVKSIEVIPSALRTWVPTNKILVRVR